MAVVRTLRHRTCSSRMRRAPATLRTWEWEGTSFSTPLDYGTKIPCCRLMVCTAQENTHLLEHTQPPLPACSSFTSGELHLLCKDGSKASITGFLLNLDKTLSSTEAGRQLFSSSPFPAIPIPQGLKQWELVPLSLLFSLGWCQFSLYLSKATEWAAVSKLHLSDPWGLWYVRAAGGMPEVQGAGSGFHRLEHCCGLLHSAATARTDGWMLPSALFLVCPCSVGTGARAPAWAPLCSVAVVGGRWLPRHETGCKIPSGTGRYGSCHFFGLTNSTVAGNYILGAFLGYVMLLSVN